MYNSVKRLTDFIIALIGIVLLALPMAVIAVLIIIEEPGQVFFSQKRVGLHKKHFMLYKFRSMKSETPHDVPTHLLENPEQYILKVGGVLRRYSLDELPQLINILKGDMSFVGPRPALWNQFDLIKERESYGANDVRPGLTGWAQINGRDEVSIEEKAKLDGEYVKRQSFGFDLKCFIGTFTKVFTADGVNEGYNTEKTKEKADKR